MIETLNNKKLTIYQTLVDSVRSYPNNIFMNTKQYSITYYDFLKEVDISAYRLHQSYNLKKGDRLALLIGNEYSFCTIFYAAMKLGVIVVPISIKLTENEIIPLLKNIAPKLIISDPIRYNIIKHLPSVNLSHWEKIAPISKTIKIDDVPTANDDAIIIFTSGTTNSPKGAMITHNNFIHGLVAYKQSFFLNETEKTILAVPIYHITGLLAILGLFVYIGGTIFLHKKFNATDILSCIKDNNITFIHGSPTVFNLLFNSWATSNSRPSLSSITKVLCGGGHLHIGTLDKIKKVFPSASIHPIYGLSETSSPACIFLDDLRKSTKKGSSGKAIDSIKILVTNDNGESVPHNTVGEIWVKGGTVINQYWNNKQANLNSFDNGWFKTGDLGYIDEDEYLFIQGRIKEMINRGGEKIYCIEVEDIISSHPSINEVALIGYPSELYGEEAVAFISLHPGIDELESNIKQWLEQKLAKYKIPKEIIFISEIPKTINYKVNKLLLREKYPKKF